MVVELYIVACDVELFKDVAYGGSMATEEIAADAELDCRDAARAVRIQQIEHSPRVTEYELFNYAVLYAHVNHHAPTGL